MSSDELFNEFIEYDSDISEFYVEKVLSKGDRKRSQKTKPVQFDMLSNFMDSHNKTTMGKNKYNHSFSALVEKLNKIGPPIKDINEWKRVWIHYKSKNLTSKKPKPNDPCDYDNTASTSMVFTTPDASNGGMIHVDSSEDHQTSLSLSPPKIYNDDNITVGLNHKFDVMIHQIEKLNGNVESLLSEQRKTNELLEKLLDKQ